MTVPAAASAPRASRRRAAHPLLLVAASLAMANLSALVDTVLHPEIPYFDGEHLLVGGVTALCGAGIYFGLSRITRRLSEARAELLALHAVVPMCAECKRVRRLDADPDVQDSWEPIERVVERMVQRQVSHGLCPMCLHKNFPDLLGGPA